MSQEPAQEWTVHASPKTYLSVDHHHRCTHAVLRAEFRVVRDVDFSKDESMFQEHFARRATTVAAWTCVEHDIRTGRRWN